MGFFRRNNEIENTDRPQVREGKLLYLIENLPVGVTIRRVTPRISDNNWCAQYKNESRCYGETLLLALQAMLNRHMRMEAKRKPHGYVSDNLADLRFVVFGGENE